MLPQQQAAHHGNGEPAVSEGSPDVREILASGTAAPQLPVTECGRSGGADLAGGHAYPHSSSSLHPASVLSQFQGRGEDNKDREDLLTKAGGFR